MDRHSLRKSLFALGGIFLSSTASAADLTWNEFGSAYYGQALNSNLLPFDFTSAHHPDFTDFSLFGLNVNTKIDDHWSAGAQLVALGDHTAAANSSNNSFNLQAAWASITYKMDNGFVFKIGRQRFPVFTASEFAYEHQQLPFREIPANVFQMAPFVAFDGAAASQTFGVGDGKLNIQIYGGTPVLAIIPPTGGNTVLSLSNLVGVRVNYEIGSGLKIRVNVARASVQSTTNTASAYADSEFFSGGYRYDSGNFVSWAEVLYRRSGDGTPQVVQGTHTSFLREGKSGYALAGYRLGDWMPRYTFSVATADLGTIGEGHTTIHTFGVNYAVNPKVTVKGEWEYDVVPNNGGGYKTTGTGGTSGSAIYAGIDFEI